jgi:hypothetical protein
MIGEPATSMELRCKNADGDRAVTENLAAARDPGQDLSECVRQVTADAYARGFGRAIF